MVNAFNHISEGTFTDDFLDFVSKTDLVALLETVVALVVVEAIVD